MRKNPHSSSGSSREQVRSSSKISSRHNERSQKGSIKDPNYEDEMRKWNETRNNNFRKNKPKNEIAAMQEHLDIENENFLSPFVFEGENEYDMCEVSVEHKEGWKAISILIDSGASDSVAPPGCFHK